MFCSKPKAILLKIFIALCLCLKKKTRKTASPAVGITTFKKNSLALDLGPPRSSVKRSKKTNKWVDRRLRRGLSGSFFSCSLVLKLPLKSHQMTTFFCSKKGLNEKIIIWVQNSSLHFKQKRFSSDDFLITAWEWGSKRKKEPQIPCLIAWFLELVRILVAANKVIEGKMHSQ